LKDEWGKRKGKIGTEERWMGDFAKGRSGREKGDEDRKFF
jgi:hypothetical protein